MKYTTEAFSSTSGLTFGHHCMWVSYSTFRVMAQILNVAVKAVTFFYFLFLFE